MEIPKVSIIVPVYNGEKYIQDTLRFILTSSLAEIEVIVINDGSQDNSLKVCRDMALADKRIRVFNQENTGVYGARNRGLLEAEGEYVCFCDQDDVVEQETYERLYLKAKAENCEVVMSSTGKIIGNQKESFERLPDIYLQKKEIGEKCILPILFNGTNCYEKNSNIRLENDIWKCMIRRNFILENEIRFRHFVNYEDDFLFLLDILARADRMAMISETLYYWRINLASETYNTPYVDQLYEKDIRLQNEVIKIMEMAQIEETYINTYIKCQNCNRYIHMVENEARNDSSNLKSKISTIKKIRQETAFYESLGIRKEYKKNLIHRKVILGMINKNHFLFAYFFHRIYIWVRKFSLQFGFWTKLENFLYSKG